MRILIVSSYPPRHCGVGVYAREQAERLRAGGTEVTVLSPPDGDGDVRAPFLGGGVFRTAAAIGGRFDRIVVHFQPALYYPPRRAVPKVASSFALLWLIARRRRRVEILVHEADPPIWWRPDHLLLWLAFRVARRVVFHTGAERRAFERSFRMRLRARGALTPHEVTAATGLTREEARRKLGIATDGETMFVCVGFVQPSKGFDRVLEAFARAFGHAAAKAREAPKADRNGNATPAARVGPAASLYLVGSVREETAENLAYIGALRSRCAQVSGATLVEGFVSDEGFDLWVAAADRVVLAYRRSWSSGVLARAHAMGTPVIVTATGGLAEQAGEDDVVVRDDDELTDALARAAAMREPAT